MPWVSTAVSVGGSLIGGFGGGSKAGERAAKDAAAAAQRQQDDLRRQANAELSGYKQSGESANQLLSQYLGTADPEGYAARPTRQSFEDEYARRHFQRYGKGYDRNSDMSQVNQWVDKQYNEAMKQWEAGKADYVAQNPDSQGDGRLLKDFTNADFVKDPGYEFRMAEGQKGLDRTFASRGGLASGSALKALERYRQDYASNEFGNAYNRDAANKGRTYSFLSGEKQTGLGAVGTGLGIAQNAANNSANAGINAANQVNQMQMNRQDNQSNAFQSALGNLIYGMERNKPVVSNRTVTNSSSDQPWYYSG
jgi:hypothetical protein